MVSKGMTDSCLGYYTGNLVIAQVTWLYVLLS